MTIFPNSLREIDQIILSFLSYPDLLKVRQVNKLAHLIALPNAQKFCAEYYPELKLALETINHEIFKNKNIEFIRIYPKNCWDIVYFVLKSGKIPQFPQSFLQDGISRRIAAWQQQILDLESEKNKLENDLKAICGDSQDDPTSPFYQAKAAYEKKSNDENFTSWSAAIEQSFDIVPAENHKKLRALFYVSANGETQLNKIEFGKAPFYEISEFLDTLGAIHERLPFIFSQVIGEYVQNLEKIRATHYEELETKKYSIISNLGSIKKDIEALKAKIAKRSSEEATRIEQKTLTSFLQQVLFQGCVEK
jgi:hypothetical protein